MNVSLKITLCRFEDCHSGQHRACRMGTNDGKNVLLFCNCPCHVKRKVRRERRSP